MSIRGKNSGSNSPRVDVGEIDTRAPFQYVRAAVSLFGEVAGKGKPAIKRAKSSSENLLDKETQLLLVQTEINKIRKKLERAESTKGRAFGELDIAKRTVQELTSKLDKALESKDLAAEETEAVRNKVAHLERVKSQNEAGIAAWKKELITTREQYQEVVADLDAAKQQVAKIRQDFDVALEAKSAACQQAEEAQRLAKINSERTSELSDQIRVMRSSLEHLKATSGQAQIEQAQIVEEKEACLEAYKSWKEEAERKIVSLKGEVLGHEEVKALESRHTETIEEIEAVRENIKRVLTSGMDSVEAVMIELDDATMALQKAANEESSRRDLITSLRKELENVRKERAIIEEREREYKLMSTQLQLELQDSSAELLELTARDKASGATNQEETSSMMAHSPTAPEDDAQEAEQIKRVVQELNHEAEKNREAAEEAKKQLELVQEEAKAAKTLQKAALERMKSMSTKMDIMDPSVSPERGWIRMPMQHFESMSRKVEESDNLAEMKLAAAAFKMEAVNVKKNETEKRVEVVLQEIEEIKAAIDLAVKQTEIADGVTMAIKEDLLRRRQLEDETD